MSNKDKKETNSAFTLLELARLTSSEFVGDSDYTITGYSDLESAGPKDVSFLSNPRYMSTRYVNAMRQSLAGVVFVAPSVALPEGKNYLINEDPSKAFQQVIVTMRGGVVKISGFQGIHPSAVVHETSQIGSGAAIGPCAVIDEGAVIGEGTSIGAGCYVGPHTVIGEKCVIHPNVTIREYCQLGNRVIVQPGSVIGPCGFGYSTDRQGKHVRLTHIGTVTIEDDVEIGANSVIDRARFTTTRIGRGSKIDNSVVIGHNVKIGEDNLICSQCGVAGSAQTGNHVALAGQCGVDGHIKLDDGVIVTGKSGVTKSLKAGKYGGYPAQNLEQHNRNGVMLRNIESHIKQLKELQARIGKLEES